MYHFFERRKRLPESCVAKPVWGWNGVQHFCDIHFSIGLRRIGFEISMPFYLQFRECDPISVLNFGNRELRIFLQSITRTICHNKAADIVRKDILPTNGVLHSQLSLWNADLSIWFREIANATKKVFVKWLRWSKTSWTSWTWQMVNQPHPLILKTNSALGDSWL